MHFNDVQYWVDKVSSEAVPTLTSSPPGRKRQRRSSCEASAALNQGLSSPPLTAMDSTNLPSLDDANRACKDDSDITPRPRRYGSPSKRRKIDGNATSDNDSPSRASTRSTLSTRTNTTGDGKSAGSRVGIKNLADLALSMKPTTYSKPDTEKDIPADALGLLRKVQALQRGQGFVPKNMRNKVQSSLRLMDMPLDDGSTYDSSACEAAAGEQGEDGGDTVSQPAGWDMNYEYEVLRRITMRTRECEVENVSEPAWNARIHEPLLDVALSPFVQSLSHWDVSRATVEKDYHPLHVSGESRNSKLVDFVIALDGIQVTTAVKNHMRRQAGTGKSINHTTYEPLRYRPIAISVETKAPDGSSREGMTQLSVWTGAYMTRLRELTSTSDKAVAGAGIGVSLPILLVRGAQWSLMFAVDHVDHTKVLDLGVIGDTWTLVGCYKLVAQLRSLADWATSTFREWFLCNALSAELVES